LTESTAEVKDQSMAMLATDIDRIEVLHDRAVARLVEAHSKRQDQPLILAVRYKPDAPDIWLLEVLGDFPGGDDDRLLETEFEPSANLMIVCQLHLVLGSPAQVRAAIERGDLAAVTGGTVIYKDDGTEAGELRSTLRL
jgi:hypothetical protein